MKRQKMFIGSRPSKESEFQFFSSFNLEGVEWHVYEDVLSSEKWWLYKVISTKPVKHKANYSLAFSPNEVRLTGKDLIVMAKHKPDMLSIFLLKSDLPKIKYWGASFSDSIEKMIETESSE